jgi:hypothetical protein
MLSTRHYIPEDSDPKITASKSPEWHHMLTKIHKNLAVGSEMYKVGQNESLFPFWKVG